MKRLRLVVREKAAPSAPPLLDQVGRLQAIEGLSRRLAVARELSALDLKQAAFRLGATVHYLFSLETSKFYPTPEELAKLAALYKCTIDWLLGLVAEMVDPKELPRRLRRPWKEGEADQLRTLLAMRRTAGPASTAYHRFLSQFAPPS